MMLERGTVELEESGDLHAAGFKFEAGTPLEHKQRQVLALAWAEGKLSSEEYVARKREPGAHGRIIIEETSHPDPMKAPDR